MVRERRTRICDNCGKAVASSTRGISKHLTVCSVAFRDQPIYQRRSLSITPPTRSPSPSGESINNITDESINDLNLQTNFKSENTLHYSDIDDDIAAFAVNQDETFSIRSLDEPTPIAFQAPPDITANGRSGSTVSSTIKETFTSNFPDNEPGKPIARREPRSTSLSPFKSEMEYAFALWLAKTKVSKGEVDAFFQDNRLEAMHNSFSYNNANEWQVKMHDILDGIPEDEWQRKEFQFSPDQYTTPICHVIYRDIIKVIKFLIGHPPFEEDLVYAPIRLRNQADQRIYTELHTGNWWWDIQRQLPRDATVIPLLLGTDKTMLTQHHGDQKAWPIYLTIGNLSRRARRAQKRPGCILLGFLPVIKGLNADDLTAHVWHEAVKIIMEPIKAYSAKGLDIWCADNILRRCHPIIAGFLADYEEQVLITGVLSNRHCTLCQVAPDDREDLTAKWPMRTHEYTQKQLRYQKQRSRKGDEKSEQWLHDVTNFAWEHHLFNVHQGMFVDVLHQLLKGIIPNIIKWTTQAIHNTKRLRIPAETLLDRRFALVPHLGSLRIFPKFSAVTQWTGVEQKNMVKQLMAVITPLLLNKSNGTLLFIKAALDFVTLAMYHTHDEDTLSYMLHALQIMNMLKGHVRLFRATKDGKQGHLNYPKWHVLTHWIEHIRLYGCADGFNTEHFEAAHKYLVKEFFSLTNHKGNYLEQIGHHNTRELSFIAMEDRLIYARSKHSNIAAGQLDEKVTSLTRAVPLNQFSGFENHKGLWCTAKEMATIIQNQDLLPALGSFLRICRARLDGRSLTNREKDLRDPDSTWVSTYRVAYSRSIKCWKRTDGNAHDTEQLDEDWIRCAANWQKTHAWRQDCVLVQEHTHNDEAIGPHASTTYKGQLAGRVNLILTIEDHDRLDSRGKPHHYSGAFIEVFKFRNKAKPHPIHGMFEVENYPRSTARLPAFVGRYRIYELSTIIRSVHLVPVAASAGGDERPAYYIINNYVDWDSYNKFYGDNWMEESLKSARKYQCL